MRSLSLIVLFLLLYSSAQAQSYTVSGYIRDAKTQESLIGLSVYDTAHSKGTTSNSYGFYSITLSKGKVNLRYSYIGYETLTSSFELTKDTTLQILLMPKSEQLAEVVVVGRNTHVESSRLGSINIPISQIKSMPSLLGESDLMKSLQLLPGVETVSEGKSDLSVRGGSPDQNLILLDGIPLYNSNHVFGFLSIFNADAVKNVNLYKAGFPARFGGRLSSVVDIRTNDGNMEHIKGSATVGLLAMKATVEGPIIKGKTSFSISMRRTYVDLFMDKVVDWIQDVDNETYKEGESSSNNDKYNFFFYDINAKLQHKISEKNSLFFLFYNGRDKMNTEYANKEGYSGELDAVTKQDWKWGSTIMASRWNHIVSGNMFLNTTFAYNSYNYDTGIRKNYTYFEYPDSRARNAQTRELVWVEPVEKQKYIALDYDSGIKDYSITSDLDFIPSPQHYFRFGAAYTYHRFKPEVISQRTGGESTDKVNYSDGHYIKAHEVAFYGEDDWDLTKKLRLNAGMRFSLFNVDDKTYTAVEPRLSFRYLLSDRLSAKVGFAHMQQYIHLLSSNSMLLQTDLWVPVTENVRPMNSNQLSAGLFYSLPGGFDFSVEAYYKKMKNVIEYKDGASFVGVSTGWQNKVERGQGRSYGIEFFVHKTLGKTTGWVSYALAKTERKFDEINYGEWFPAKYDRRHSVNVTVTHQLSKHFDLSANWLYSTGSTMTIPMTEVVHGYVPEDPYPSSSPVIDQIEQRNNYRMKGYHRVDLGVSYYTSRNTSRHGIWNFSVYNAYNQMNPFIVFTDYNEDQNGKYTKVMKQITIFPFIPSLSYTYKF